MKDILESFKEFLIMKLIERFIRKQQYLGSRIVTSGDVTVTYVLKKRHNFIYLEVIINTKDTECLSLVFGDNITAFNIVRLPDENSYRFASGTEPVTLRSFDIVPAIVSALRSKGIELFDVTLVDATVLRTVYFELGGSIKEVA